LQKPLTLKKVLALDYWPCFLAVRFTGRRILFLHVPVIKSGRGIDDRKMWDRKMKREGKRRRGKALLPEKEIGTGEPKVVFDLAWPRRFRYSVEL
jgi:hypothetical protein